MNFLSMRKRMLAVVLASTMIVPNGVYSYNLNDAKAATVKSENYDQKTDMGVEASGGIGSIFAKELEEKSNSFNGPSSIYDVKVKGNKATVHYSASEKATLFIGLYSDDDKTLYTLESQDIAKTNNQDGTFDVAEFTFKDMPKYFNIHASIVSRDRGRALSGQYTDDLYTEEMQKFLSKTTDDFKADQVMNLDESKSENFVVFDDKIKQISTENGKNKVESMDDKYTLTVSNISDEVKNLKEGSEFSFGLDEEGNLQAGKVKSITIDGDVAKIVLADDFNMDDIFTAVNINTASEDINDQIASSDLKSSSLSAKFSNVNHSKDFSIAKASVSGSASSSVTKTTAVGTFTAKMSGKYSAYASVSGKVGVQLFLNLKKRSVKLSFTVTTDVGFEMSGSAEAKFTFKSIIVTPVAGVNIKLTPSISLSAKGEVIVKGKKVDTIWMGWADGSGVTAGRSSTFNPTVKVNATVTLTVELAPALSITGVITFKGLAAGVSLIIYGEANTVSSKWHHTACNATCLQGTVSVSAHVTLGASIELKVLRWHKNVTLIKPTTKTLATAQLCYWHYCPQHKSFGSGLCTCKGTPTKQTNVKVVNSNSKALVKNATVKTTSKSTTSKKSLCAKETASETAKTGTDGVAQMELALGTYDFEVEVDGQVFNAKDKEVDEETGVLTLMVDKVKATAAPVATSSPADGSSLESTFTDEKFRTYVKKFDTNKDNALSETEISEVKKIAVDGNGISSLKGIEVFTELESLSCKNNALTALDVSKNTKLTTISCEGNKITSLDVSALKKLTNLLCGNNALTSLKVSGADNLTELYCEDNQLSAIDISSNSKLMVLSCKNNRITTIDASKNADLSLIRCDDDVEVVKAGVSTKSLKKMATDKTEKASFKGLKSNGSYTFYVFNDSFKYDTDTVSSENVKYMIQKTADGNGNLEIEYVATGSNTKLVASDLIDLADVDVKVNEYPFDGEYRMPDMVVTYDGVELVLGKDYEITGGDDSVREVGSYTAEITGKKAFTGTRKVNFSVLPKKETTVASNVVLVKSIDVTPSKTSVAAGDKVKMSASVSPSNCTNSDVEWTVSDTSIASVDSDGNVTFASTAGGQTVVVSAYAKDESYVIGKYEFNVQTPCVKSIKLKAASKTVKAGKSVKIKATVTTIGTGVSKKLTWKVSNKKYATVSKSGVVKTKKAGKGKKVKVTATSASGKKASVTIKIK